jgi:hypothetical protein
MWTVEQDLENFIAHFRSDKFWKDMAFPLEQAIPLMAKGDPESRAKAVALFNESKEMLSASREAGIFTHEANVVTALCNKLGDESFTLQSPSSELNVQEQTQEEKAAEAQVREAMTRLESAQGQKLKAYDFTHTPDKQEMTVTIAVPAETKKADVKVNCSADTLKVEVKGHQLQPVVEGKLFEKVDVDAFDWHLEGSGDKRVLILDLEKVMGGLDWPDLLKR